VFFHGLTKPTKPTAPRPILSLYGIIYVTWYTSGLPEATGVRLRLPNSYALLGSGRPWKTPLLFLQTLTFRKNIVYNEQRVASVPKQQLSVFSHFEGTSTCDGRTDTRRQGHSILHSR